MGIYDVIAKKRDGGQLSSQDIQFFVDGVTNGNWKDYQISAMLMAMFIQGLNHKETSQLTMAMAASGEEYDLSSIPGVKVDKHSTGGVGDKTTPVLGAIVASLGVPVAKMSGRGLGFTGGTADKLEAMEGYRTTVTYEEFLKNVREIGISLITQSGELCPADKKLYALRDVTGTVESTPLIVSSIMSKKIAAGCDKIVLDVKVGSGAFMKTVAEGEDLALSMIAIGERCGRETVAVLSDMDTPLGRKIGNTLEMEEVLDVLQNRGPEDLTEECITLAGMMLKLAGKGSFPECKAMAKAQLENGKAYEKFLQLVQRQGGKVQDGQVVLRREPVEEGQLTAWADGYVSRMDALSVGMASVTLGAGRQSKEDTLNLSAGLVLHKKPGEPVKQGETILTVYGKNAPAVEEALERLKQGVEIAHQPPKAKQRLLGILDKNSIED